MLPLAYMWGNIVHPLQMARPVVAVLWAISSTLQQKKNNNIPKPLGT